jgi:hypothetical protein
MTINAASAQGEIAMRHNSKSLPVSRHGQRAGFFQLRARQMSLLSLFLLVTAMPVLAFASELRVRVFERGGKQPLAGVSVCLGTSANLIQFGSDQTDSGGYAVFADVPRAPLLITASKSGYKGGQQSLVTSSIPRLLVMSLPAGGGGPVCTPVGGRAAVNTGGLQISDFSINEGETVSHDRQVQLDHRVSGHPSEYRASENPDISAAQWMPYSARPVYVLSPGNGKKTVYFQVRRYSKINGADIQTLSPIVHDTIVLQAH